MKNEESTGKAYENAPVGTHIATLIKVVDLGTQPWNKMGSDEVDHKLTVRLTWELPNELMSDGRPFTVQANYKRLTNEKSNYSKLFKQWVDVPVDKYFNPKAYLGHSGLMTVAHKTSGDKVYANVASLSPLMKGMAPPVPVNTPVYFDLDDFDGQNRAIFDLLTKYEQEMIQKSPEYQAIMSGERHDGQLDDSIPF